MTVVGIPGRVVLPLERRRITHHGIDLDHHLMPDPVGKAISCLIERINQLEARLGIPHDGEGLAAAMQAIDCEVCDDSCDQARFMKGSNPHSNT